MVEDADADRRDGEDDGVTDALPDGDGDEVGRTISASRGTNRSVSAEVRHCCCCSAGSDFAGGARIVNRSQLTGVDSVEYTVLLMT